MDEFKMFLRLNGACSRRSAITRKNYSCRAVQLTSKLTDCVEINKLAPIPVCTFDTGNYLSL